MKNRLFIFILVISIQQFSFGQYTNRDNYDLKNPGRDLEKKCAALNTALRQVPFEDRFSTRIINDSVYLLHSSESWFWKLIPDRNDGIAVDLISKNQYTCDNVSRISGSWSHKGYLLPPRYRDDAKRNLLPASKGYVAVFMGVLPPAFRNKQEESNGDIEVNYLIVENKNVCHYTNIVNVESYGWELLNNGLYYDTLGSENLEQRYNDISKTLHFVIPFERSRSDYNEKDIKPLYDSLKLTDYQIKAIRIHAYTSVEGSEETNNQLQRSRTGSIVNALQTFQPETLSASITSSENWVEFLEDISSSPFNFLSSLSKNEIKEKLKSQDLLTRMEPILKNHRKAVIELDLEKRITYLKSSSSQLKQYFDQEIASRNVEEALYLQQIIFYRIKKHELPDEFLNELELPQADWSSSLLINEASFRYENISHDPYEALRVFEQLDKLLKNNKKVRYNICALKLRAWLSAPATMNAVQLKKDIESLSKLGIPAILVRRLMINYHIITSEIALRERKYAEKDRAVKYIFDTYKSLSLNDEDLVNLAKYLSHNSRFDLAEKILEPRMTSISVSEDAIFYYLSLSIFDQKNTKNAHFRTIMLNAVNANRERYCGLFKSISNGGVSFQLLDDPFLKKTYCENCR